MTSKAKEQRTTQPAVFSSFVLLWLLCFCCCFQGYAATVEIQQPLVAQTDRTDQAENEPVLCAAIKIPGQLQRTRTQDDLAQRDKNKNGAVEGRPLEEETDPWGPVGEWHRPGRPWRPNSQVLFRHGCLFVALRRDAGGGTSQEAVKI